MTSKIIMIVLMAASLNITMAAETANAPAAAGKAVGATTQLPAAEAEKGKILPEGPSLPAKDTAEYWVVRTQAVNELTAFLTKKRGDLKNKVEYFKDYMGTIGVDYTKDFFSADVQVPNDMRLRMQILGILDKLEERDIKIPEKPLAWEEMVTFAMQMEIEEGYLPVQIETPEELDQFKTILDRKEKFAMKVREDAEKYIQTAMKAWVYLGQLGKQEEFKTFIVRVREDKKHELEARREEVSQENVAQARQRREQEKQNVWQNRQDRLMERYDNYGYYYY